MVKNKLEKLFSKSMHYFDWCMKLHNNPLAHQNTPADYIASHRSFGNSNTVILFECKQVTCKEGKGRLAFKRLKQLHDLLTFDNLKIEHKSFFVFAFLDKRWNDSEVYLVPAIDVDAYIRVCGKESINREEAKEFFKNEKLEINGGELKFEAYI